MPNPSEFIMRYLGLPLFISLSLFWYEERVEFETCLLIIR